MLNEDQILQALRDCYDPEIQLNVVDLGMIASISLQPDPEAPGAGIPGVPARFAVRVSLLPVERDETINAQLLAIIHNRMAGLPELSKTTIDIADAPPWSPARIASSARTALGLDRPHFPILNNRLR